MENIKLLYTVYAARWTDKTAGNTYHSCRIIRHSDSQTLCAPMQYGYDEHYRQTALELMLKSGWLPEKYEKNTFMFERENNYPINWIVTDGLKRDCIANGKN